VANRVKETSFDSNDTRALSALAGYATIAINNANIFRESQLERNTLSAVIDEMEEPLLVIDGQNRLLMLNAAARSVLNITDENVSGKSVADFVQHEELLSFMLQTTEEGIENQALISGPNGRSFKALLKFIPGGGRAVHLQPQ
jgi:transcriptional regulator with PAS, ATPase and Fis domain